MSNLISLIEEYTLPSVLVILIVSFLAVKEICSAVAWVKEKLNAYHDKRNQSEDEKEDMNERLTKLEKHDNWQYNALLDMTKSLQTINTTLIDMQKRQDAVTVATSRSTLYRLHADFMNKGYVTKEDLKTFTELGKLYALAGGNDIVHLKLEPEVFALPIRE